MSAAPQAEQEIVNGIVQGVIAKGDGKYQIEVNTGQQNPRRLWTKDEGVVQQMMAMVGQQLSFMCGVSHWTNNSGQQVRSLWLNGFGQPGQQTAMPVQQPVNQPVSAQPQQWQQPQAPAAQAPMPTPVAPTPAPQRDLREEKIHRQTATKVAVDLLKYLKPEDHSFQNLIALSERLVSYYEGGVQWPQTGPQAGTNDGDPGPQDVPHTDDDIPF